MLIPQSALLRGSHLILVGVVNFWVFTFFQSGTGSEFVFHFSLANIFNKCHNKAVFMKNTQIWVYKI